jgi:hypothetical protein
MEPSTMPTNQGKCYKNRTIVLPFDEAEYRRLVAHPALFREELSKFMNTHPKLFPEGIENGFLTGVPAQNHVIH